MYVCICHALNDKKVKVALESGARTPASIFRHHACQVQCGKCVATMRAMADDHIGSCSGCLAAAPEPANSDAIVYGIAAE